MRPITAIAAAVCFAFCIQSAMAADDFPKFDCNALDGVPINKDVEQSNIGETICKKGWTRTVRPPEEVTQEIKRKRLMAAGEPTSDAKRYELDHITPLELGGNPIDPLNLQLQLWPEARQKDRVENCLREAVCAGKLLLNEARFMIWHDWRKAGTHCNPPERF